MRKVVAGLFVSLDGVAESPDEWQFDAFDDDMGVELVEEISALDTILLGRVTYEMWNNFWPTASYDQDFATFINTTPKYVVSNTLDSVTWGDYDTVHLIKGNPSAEINRLKALPGKNIGVSGSPGLTRSLLQLGLLDELTLMIHPVAAGKGKRLFKDSDDLKRLKLVRSKITGSGVAILTYAPHS